MYTAPYAAWHTPVFLLNSRLGRFAATHRSDRREASYPNGHPFFRSYGIIMPSSLTTFHSFTLGFSPRPPVSVYGTDTTNTPFRAFLACRLHKTRIGVAPSTRTQVSSSEELYTLGRSIHKTALASFQCPSEVQRDGGGAGILTGWPSATPLGPRLRFRLTLR